jgi:hypothetical protein
LWFNGRRSGVLHWRRGRPWWLSRGDGASREVAGLFLVARPEEDEGGRGPMVRERKGGARPMGQEWGGGLGGLGQPAGQGLRSGRASWAAKDKKKEIHSKLISRFRKMNKEIQVTEIIGKIPRNL